MAVPSGVVTFLFTDVVGSSSRWDSAAPEMGAAIRRHDELIGAAVSENSGHLVKSMGDGMMAAFADPADAVSGALAAQSAIATEEWPAELEGIRVRMGVH
ncbi:MAG: adenylate/guanylate cyclase domain-containing protein, partial [Microthrixaceae bacterium]